VGQLNKTNPHATRRSALVSAIGGGVVGGLFGFFQWLRLDLPFWAVYFIVPSMITFCALCGWEMEWQLPTAADEGYSPASPPAPPR